MGYYIRFISIDEKKIHLKEIESAIKANDSNYKIDRDDEDDVEGLLIYGDDLYGQLEINEKGDDIFEDEIEVLKEDVENSKGKNKERILDFLNEAKALLFVRVLTQDRNWEETLIKIDPIWNWLNANRIGFVQADGEGYYEGSELIFRVK